MLEFDTSLSIEEIKANFENINFYEQIMDALHEALEYERARHRGMDRNYFDDIYYVASIIEYTARRTRNTKSNIVQAMGAEAFREFVDLADVNHCLPFLQVSDELIEQYGIVQGTYELPLLHAKPSYLQVGAAYAKLVTDTESVPSQYWRKLYEILAIDLGDRSWR